MIVKYNATKERLAAFIEETTGEYHDISEYSRVELTERVEWVEENSVDWYGVRLLFVEWVN